MEAREDGPAGFTCGGVTFETALRIPLMFGDDRLGTIGLGCEKPNRFTEADRGLFDEIGRTLGMALVHRRTQVALRERLKELTCLYGISQVLSQPGRAFDDLLKRIVELLPPAWLYPDAAVARIALDGISHSTPGFDKSTQRMTAEIFIEGKRRGAVEVGYLADKPPIDEGPFLKEERSLINTVARDVGALIERREAEDDMRGLEEKLRHADRLATIGQLAANVAHELNEPLGSILGFAQLAGKAGNLPKQAEQDIGRIIAASLHARDIIRRLMSFARQMPPQSAKVNLNRIVNDGLSLLENRFAKEGIELVRKLPDNLPDLTADPTHLHQIIINLVVNAIQAMPSGGRLTIQTVAAEDHVCLVVEDTGVGMSREVLSKIYVPFFTTKGIRDGTGLGLSVVHDIVTSYGGSIVATSEVNKGARFEVCLPINGSSCSCSSSCSCGAGKGRQE
jgi:two-component system NtrC family sensor kinase